MAFNPFEIAKNASNFIGNSLSTAVGGLSNKFGGAFDNTVQNINQATESRNAGIAAAQQEAARKEAEEKARKEALDKALSTAAAFNPDLVDNFKNATNNINEIASSIPSMFGEEESSNAIDKATKYANNQANLINAWNPTVQTAGNVASNTKNILKNTENSVSNLIGQVDKEYKGKKYANEYKYNDYNGMLDPWGIGEANFADLYAGSDSETKNNLMQNKKDAALASLGAMSLAAGQLFLPGLIGGAAAVNSGAARGLVQEAAQAAAEVAGSTSLPLGIRGILDTGTITPAAATVPALASEYAPLVNGFLAGTGLLGAANIADQNISNSNSNSNKQNANVFNEWLGSLITNEDLMRNNERYSGTYDYANNLTPEERSALHSEKLDEYNKDHKRTYISALFNEGLGNMATRLLANSDPDFANPNNYFYNYLTDFAVNRLTNNGENMDNPWLVDQYTNFSRPNEDERWKVLINTNAAPKEYDQMDRLLYYVSQTPGGYDWINEIDPELLKNVSKEDLKNMNNGLDNLFTKWRMNVLPLTEAGKTGSMSDSVDRMFGDIFSDATGIKLARDKKTGKLQDESRGLVDAWALAPENIFWLDEWLSNPAEYVNDPTFLNYGFDANAILDLTQTLMKNGVLPLDIENTEGMKQSAFNADDMAQYMTTALLQRQNELEKEKGLQAGISGGRNQAINLDALNAIFKAAGDKTFTSDVRYGVDRTKEALHEMQRLNPGNEESWYAPYITDEEDKANENLLSDRFVDTILAMNPELYVYDPEKYYKATEEAKQPSMYGSSNAGVNLLNPMWW